MRSHRNRPLSRRFFFFHFYYPTSPSYSIYFIRRKSQVHIHTISILERNVCWWRSAKRVLAEKTVLIKTITRPRTEHSRNVPFYTPEPLRADRLTRADASRPLRLCSRDPPLWLFYAAKEVPYFNIYICKIINICARINGAYTRYIMS